MTSGVISSVVSGVVSEVVSGGIAVGVSDGVLVAVGVLVVVVVSVPGGGAESSLLFCPNQALTIRIRIAAASAMGRTVPTAAVGEYRGDGD